MFRKFLKIILFLIGLAGAIYLAALIYVVSFSLNKNLPTHADAALVLGAKVNLNNTPSEPLLNRTSEATALYKQGKIDYILTTGGTGLGYVPESRESKKIAISQGVPSNKIFDETDSHTTYENIEDIVDIAKQNNIKSVIVVSDRFHVARGVLVAKFFDFDPVYWDYPALGYYKKDAVAWSYAREAAALIVYIPRLIFGHP